MKRQSFWVILTCCVAASALWACSNDSTGSSDPQPDAQCTYGAQKCDDDVIVVCNEFGEYTKLTDCTKTNRKCKADGDYAKCYSQSNPSPDKCTLGDKKCIDDAVNVCNSSGEYEISTKCEGETPKCQVVDGTAQCTAAGTDPTPECEPNKTECSGDVLKTCSDAGTWVEKNCATLYNTTCESTETGAKCADPVVRECQENETKCDGAVLKKCSDDFEWVVDVDCRLNDDAIMCIKGEDGVSACSATCPQGYSYCAGGKIYTCNDSGLFDETKTCEGDTPVCDDDKAGTAECKPEPVVPEACEAQGTTCLDDNTIKICTNLHIVETRPCAELGEGFVCKIVDGQGTCQAPGCQEGASRCQGIRYQVVCQNGVEVPTSCDAKNNFYCETVDGVGACRKHEPKPGENDFDGDTIPDDVEGRILDIDTDGDTVPDWKDWDSDGDTIPDAVEGYVDDDGDTIPNFRDSDSDNNGIPDSFEGCRNPQLAYQNGQWPKPIDVDPNYKTDDNSPLRCNTPIDTDKDTIADYIDYDNDGDGAVDTAEIEGMSLGSHKDPKTFSGQCPNRKVKDGEPQNIKGSPENPVDCDGDDTPDYMSTDSDGDTLPDKIEAMLFYGDHYARYSLDTDGDTIPDSIEGQPIVDGKLPDSTYNIESKTYGNGIPDILELDSDGDGLADAWEEQHKAEGYDRTKYDSDGDGSSDLIEYGAGTSPKDPNDNPETRGNFVFVTPYLAKSTPEKQTLSFETAIQKMDIFFAFDRTASMGDEIRSLRTNLSKIIDGVKCKDLGKACEQNIDCKDTNAICSDKKRCIRNPKLGEDGKGCLDDIYTGLGYYTNENTFWVAAPISSDTNKTVDALKAAFHNNGNGGFCYQGIYEPPYQIPICAILGETAHTNGRQYCKAGGTRICQNTPQTYCSDEISDCTMNCVAGANTCVGYRDNAIRLHIQSFDEEQCWGNNYTINGETWQTRCKRYQHDVGGIMKAHKVRWIGLWGDAPREGGYKTVKDYAYPNSEKDQKMDYVSDYIGKASGTLDKNGKPFTYEATDAAVAEKTKLAILDIAKNMPIQITTTKEDVEGPKHKGANKLIERLVLNTSGDKVQGRLCTKITNTVSPSGNLPGIKDLLPGTSVCYDVIPVQNQSIFPATNEPQVVQARIKVLGDGSVLNSGIAYFLIPPKIEGPNT